MTKAKNPVYPKFHDWDTSKLLDRLVDLNRVDDKTNKPREREEEIKGYRRDLQGKYITPFKKGYRALGVNEKKEIIASIVHDLAKEHYGALGRKMSEGEKLTPDELDSLVFEVTRGQVRSYAEFLKHAINEGDLDYNVDSPGGREQQSLLYQLLEHVAEGKHTEGKEAQTIERTLMSQHEHRDGTVSKLGEIIGKDYNASAEATEVLRDFRQHTQLQGAKYDQLRETTYGKKKSAGGDKYLDKAA